MSLIFRVACFFLFGLVILLNSFLFFRYAEWGVCLSNIMLSIGLFDLVLLIATVSIIKKREFVNPYSIYSIFLFLLIYSFLPLSDNFFFSTELTVLLVLSVCSYLIGVSLNVKKRIVAFPVFSIRTRRWAYYSLFFLCILSFIYEVTLIGYVPLLAVLSGNFNVYSDAGDSMTILHTFVLMSPILLFWTLLLSKQGVISHRTKKRFLPILIFVICNNFGRTSLLMLVIIGLFYIDFYYKLSFKKIFIGMFSFVFLFVFMGNIRSGSTIDVMNEVLQRIGKSNYETSIFESYLLSYSSVNFYKINEVIDQKQKLNYASYGKNSLKPLVKLFGGFAGSEDTVPEFQTQQHLSTYISDPYLDFGMLGVIVLNVFYGVVANLLFIRYKRKDDPEYIISWGIFVFCILMGCFFNAFNTMLVWIIYVSNKILLKNGVRLHCNV
ncbi:O-antigen polymerase [Phocaeicola sp.]